MKNNITIGIISKNIIKDNIIYQAINKENFKYLNNKCDYIGIMNYYEEENINTSILNLCDGIIFQGGKDIYPYYYKVLEYAINNNIPVLGICLGHQLIGNYSNNNIDKLVTVKNHNNVSHKINIISDSWLHKIFGNNSTVNSRHNFALSYVKEPFKIVAKSDDNTIEAIEYIDDNHFILGVQFHPEDMDNMDTLYNNFIKEIIMRKKDN